MWGAVDDLQREEQPGNVYPYFACAGQHSKRTDCTRQAILIQDVEKLIEDYYQRIQIQPYMRQALAGMLTHEFDQLMSTEANELGALTSNRDKLEDEQTRLMQAHYADAIPLSVLKREQDRISAELEHISRRLESHHGQYTEAKLHLEDALNFLENCADIYSRCDDANRRLCNQAFFTRIYLDEDELQAEYARPFGMLLDQSTLQDVAVWNENKARTSTIDSSVGSSSLVRTVGPVGIEPTTRGLKVPPTRSSELRRQSRLRLSPAQTALRINDC